MAGEMASSLTSMGGGLAVASARLMPLIRSGKEFNPFRLVFGDGRDVCTDASPLCHVGKGGGLPPFLILCRRERPAATAADGPRIPRRADQGRLARAS